MDFSLSAGTDTAVVRGDQNSIEQSLVNIIDNAIKYTESGLVKVAITSTDKIHTVKIEDTGIGMSEEYVQSLFQPFSQESEGYTKKFQGLGLGLALTQRYLDKNNVALDVHSQQGQGTRFTLTFPAPDDIPG